MTDALDASQTDVPGLILRRPFSDSELLTQLRALLRIAEAEQRARESQELQHAVLGGVGQCVVVAGDDGRVLYASPNARGILGLSTEESERIGSIHDALGSLSVDHAMLEERGVVEGIEHVVRDRRGTRRAVQIDVKKVDVFGGSLLYHCREVASGNHTESRLRDSNRELKRKNNEVEQFAYTISHDLKSPLLTISGFLGHLRNAILQGKVEDSLSYLTRIDNAAKRMNGLIEDLLQLRRVERREMEPQSVDLDGAIRSLLQGLADRFEESQMTVSIKGRLPTVTGDPSQVNQLFENLLANAILHGSDHETPRLEIGKAKAEGFDLVYVRDNGKGISSEHQGKIFQLFERLDTKAPGSGMGLAIAKRIIERHGGRIWVDSYEGQGTTFWLSFPKADGNFLPTQANASTPQEESNPVLV